MSKDKWTYFQRKADVQLSPCFHLWEFRCRGEGCCPITWVHKDLLKGLDALRAEIGKPVIINSAYRCPNHNAAEGGAEKSYHQLGMAVDIRVANMEPEHLANLARELFTGIGIYNTFVHVDVRAIPYEFDKRT